MALRFRFSRWWPWISRKPELATAIPPDTVDLARCAVLVPFQHWIEPDTERALDAVERLGVRVFRKPGCSAIDYARSEMASGAVIDGLDAFMFIDSDMLFSPEDVLYMLRRPEPVVGGLYSQKGFGKLNTHLHDGVTEIHVGGIGEDYHPSGIGAGFLRIRCDFLADMADRLQLPLCTAQGSPTWPFFLSLTPRGDDGTAIYLGEDYAFCHRCLSMGCQPILDTRPRLFHIGRYYYGVDDAGRQPPQRLASFTVLHGRSTGKPLEVFGSSA